MRYKDLPSNRGGGAFQKPGYVIDTDLSTIREMVCPSRPMVGR